MSQYNPQQPYYNFQQHTPGPPQPQWQANIDKKGWGDPRLSQPSPTVSSPVATNAFPPQYGYGATPGPQQLPPPPPPPAGGFPLAPHQHAPSASQHDTSGWGVRHNQNQGYTQPQDNSLRPPLPPRPASVQGVPQPGWSSQTFQQKPPTPPPRPPEYAPPHQQAQSHYYPHEQYSDRPTSHHYDPSAGQWPGPQAQHTTLAPPWQQAQQFNDDPVSPIEHHHQLQAWPSSTPTPAPQNPSQPYGQQPPQQAHHPQQSTSIPLPGPSALGSGGPSDWQHFPGDEQYYHEQAQQQQHGRQNSQSFTITPEQIHATPAHSSPVRLPQGIVAAQTAQHSSPGHVHPTPLTDQSIPTAGDSMRQGSDATASSTSIPQRAGTIDSVIQAWSTPGANNAKIDALKLASRPASILQQPPPAPREVTNTQTQTDFPPIVKTETKIETKVEIREIDPYEDLKNEYRTSLNRYAAMLRQEITAKSEQEKMKVVFDFVNREVKLRSVMFNAEPAELIRSSELAELRKAADKAKEEEVMRIPSKPKDGTQSTTNTRTAARPPQIDTQSTPSQHSRDDSFVVVNADSDEAEYSPGGRPKVAMPTKTPVQQRPRSPATQISPARVANTRQRLAQPGSPSDNAPMTLDDYITPERHTTAGGRSFNTAPAQFQRPGSTNPPALVPGQVGNNPAPIPFQPPRPAYTPFRYNEASEPTNSTIDVSKSANEAYMRLRHDQAAESGRLLSQEPPLLIVTAMDRNQNATPSRARQQQQEAFIGLLRQQSKAIKKPSSAPPPSDAPAPLRIGTPLKRRPSLPPLVKSSESLRESLPQNLAQLTFPPGKHPKIVPINSSVTKVVDDFGYIHATVVAWDKENRKHRQELDAERADRESDNQSRVDELFHENQIGYADIAGLEEDFKLEEASKKYQEDQDELDSFTRNVFDRVTERLESELAELETLRVQTLDILDLGSQSASGRIQTALSSPARALEKAPLADAMTIMLQLFNKIETRYTKIAEAHFERERRRKRLELTVLYTNGDTAGVKKLEKDFDKAQSLQLLSEARKRDERANKLMDSFDRAAVRGLAENQEWLDEMSNKATLLRDLVLGSESNGPQGQNRQELLYGPGGIREMIDMLQEAVSMVLQDSRELVQMSSQADKILNEADFAMFLAEAKIAESGEKEFEKLKAEKTKEDQKLTDESDNRTSGVKRVPDEIFEFIREIRNFIGNDKDFQTRINQALDAAKRRNQPGLDVGAVREV